jgi:GAF domain-containing protein
VTEAEVAMSDDPGVTSVRADGTPEFALPAGLELVSDTSDPGRLAHLIVEAIVPGFADSAGVFVLEQKLTGGSVSQLTGNEVVVRRLATILTVDGSPIPGAVLPSAQVIEFAADSPYARCVQQQAPVIFAQPGDQTMQRVTRGARMALGQYASFLVAPLTARDQALGFLVFGRSAGQEPFGDDDAATAAGLAANAGAGIARSLGAAAARTRRGPASRQR